MSNAQYPKMSHLDHIIASGLILLLTGITFFVIFNPMHMNVWAGLTFTFILFLSSMYFLSHLYNYLKVLEVGRDDRAKLEAEIVELKTRIKDTEEIHTRTCEDANREHSARRKLEAATFRAIQLLHSATRFKSTEAQEVATVLELAMFETLGVDSKLRDEITNLKEGA